MRPVSRYQFIFAILMFANAPAWIVMVVLAAFATPLGWLQFDPAWTAVVAAALLVMSYAPKVASLVDTLVRDVDREGTPVYNELQNPDEIVRYKNAEDFATMMRLHNATKDMTNEEIEEQINLFW